jgi:hypothetical protein
MDYRDALDMFRGTKLSGKIVATIAGGGYSFLDIMKLPGASDKIENVYCPYGKESLVDFTAGKEDIAHIVSAEMSKVLAIDGKKYLEDKDLYIFVGSTAALRTNRKRRGEEAAYITIINKNIENTYKVTFNSHTYKDESSDWIRSKQDTDLGQIMFALICGNKDMYPESTIYHGGNIGIHRMGP